MLMGVFQFAVVPLADSFAWRSDLTLGLEAGSSIALQAARQIQTGMVPARQSVHGGPETDIVYLAAEEVGGDFCQVVATAMVPSWRSSATWPARGCRPPGSEPRPAAHSAA